MKHSLFVLSLLASSALAWQVSAASMDTNFTADAALYSENDAYTSPKVNFSADGNYTVTVSARGTKCQGGWPIMKVQIGDYFSATTPVETDGWQDFTFNAPVKAGSFPVTLVFTNDCYVQQEDGSYDDRNLYINTVKVSPAAASNASSAAPQTLTVFQANASLLRTNDSFSTPSVNFSADGTYPITVSAKGTVCQKGWPSMKVTAGSDFSATQTVSATSWKDFTFNAPLKSGSKAVTVTFTNDCYARKSDGTYTDRNLYINTVTVGHTTDAPPATTAPTTPTPPATTPAPTTPAPSVQGILSAPVNFAPALTSIPTGQGAVWYVSGVSGSDSNDGKSAQTPFKTISRAIHSGSSQFKGGDIAVVMPGTYRETIRVGKDGTPGGTPNVYTTIMGMPGQARPVIIGNQSDQEYYCFTCSAIQVWAPYVRISGLDVSAPGGDFRGTGINMGIGTVNDANGVARPIAHHIIVDNNIVHDSASAGIGVGSVDYATVQNNVVYGNANLDPGQASGIDVITLVDYDNAPGYHVQILNNVSYNNVVKVGINYTNQDGVSQSCSSDQPNCHSDGNGIIVDSNNTTHYKSKILIFGNLAYDNGARGINVYNSSNPVDIINNTAYHNIKDTNIVGYPDKAGAELEDLNAGAVRYYNNIAVPLNAQLEALCICSDIAATFKYNLTYGPGFSYFGNGVGTPDSSNKINVDPQFVSPSTNPASNNFCLKSGSPAIGAGAVLGNAVTDASGHTLAAGQAPNLGACFH